MPHLSLVAQGFFTSPPQEGCSTSLATVEKIKEECSTSTTI